MTAHILIVDDNQLYREGLARMLYGCFAGIRLTSVSDGNAALQLLRRQPFTLLMLDYQMPGLSGGDVVRQLRANVDQLPQGLPPIVLMSTQADVSIYSRSLGVAAFLAKPPAISELERVVGPLLADAATAGNSSARLWRIQLR